MSLMVVRKYSEKELETISEHIEAIFNRDLSGSGFDCDWEVVGYSVRSQLIHIKSYFHLMNGNGYYCGYTPIHVYLRISNGILMIHSVKAASEKNGVYLGDYISEMVHSTLDGYDMRKEGEK